MSNEESVRRHGAAVATRDHAPGEALRWAAPFEAPAWRRGGVELDAPAGRVR